MIVQVQWDEMGLRDTRHLGRMRQGIATSDFARGEGSTPSELILARRSTYTCDCRPAVGNPFTRTGASPSYEREDSHEPFVRRG